VFAPTPGSYSAVICVFAIVCLTVALLLPLAGVDSSIAWIAGFGAGVAGASAWLLAGAPGDD
jgi:hypothetical protein